MYRNIVLLQDSMTNRVKDRIVFNATVLSLDLLSNDKSLIVVYFDRKSGTSTHLKAGMGLGHRFFNILRIEIATSYNDQILTATGDEQLVVLTKSQVARSQIIAITINQASMKYLICFFGFVPITNPDTRTGNPNFSDPAFRQLLVRLRIDNQYLRVWKKPPTADKATCRGGILSYFGNDMFFQLLRVKGANNRNRIFY